MKRLLVLFLGLGICFPLSQVSAQKIDSAPQSIFIRLYIDTTQNILQQDTEQELLGPSVRLDTFPCAISAAPTAKYSARTRSQDSSVILKEYPLGDLRPIIFKDSVDPKDGSMTGGREIQTKGVVDICVPFSDSVAMVEIFEPATGRVATNINISGLLKKDTSDTNQGNRSVGPRGTTSLHQNGDAIPTRNIVSAPLFWILSLLVLLAISVAIYKFFKKKSSTAKPLPTKES